MRHVAVEAVLTAVVTTLKASAGVMALVTGVFNHVPQGTAYPYVQVTSPTDRRVDTMGRFGAETLVDVKVVSQAQGDQEAARVLDQCVRALDLQPLTLTDHAGLGIAWESSDRFAEVVNAVITRHHVATFRVWTEQSA